jgi:formylglycine-generating enzyme
LPTEAEWEYACRAGTTTWFSSGNDPESLAQIANVADRSAQIFWGHAASNWTFLRANDGYAFTSPVGSFKPNAWGLYDMHGNVWEWCADRYSSTYYRGSPTDDPTGAASGDVRGCRGGSWGTRAQLCRAAKRNPSNADEAYRFIGFRPALEPPFNAQP